MQIITIVKSLLKKKDFGTSMSKFSRKTHSLTRYASTLGKSERESARERERCFLRLVYANLKVIESEIEFDTLFKNK